MTDTEWDAWQRDNALYLEVIRAHLLFEVMRHAGTLGALIVPQRYAYRHLRHAYPNDPPEFHERVAADFVANIDSLRESPLALVYAQGWLAQDDARKARGEPCPCWVCCGNRSGR